MENEIINSTPEKPKVKKVKSDVSTSSGGPGRLITAVILTAIVIGGAIYAWQSQAGEQIRTQADQALTETKTGYEDRLNNLKEKLSGVEAEKAKLESDTQALAEKAKLLEAAELSFRSDIYKFGFRHPAVFGVPAVTENKTASGTMMSAVFPDSTALKFGGASSDYSFQGTGTPAVFAIAGFIKKGRDYLVKVNGTDIKVAPTRVFNAAGGEGLLLDKNSFGGQSPVEIGGNLIALVNLPDRPLASVVFLNSDFGVLPVDNFVKLVQTLSL